MKKLLEPGKIGDVAVENRVFMAPLTRNRAHSDGTPSDIAIEYYAQRATSGLIITEATQISPEGKGYIDTPGIHNQEQAAAWKVIVEEVHRKDGRIFLQLWHVGRISHVSLQPAGAQPVAPSAVVAKTQTFTPNGVEDVSAPRQLSVDEIRRIVKEYIVAAKLAQDAGFDGVEVHGANGYLLNQFISTNTNLRTDEYGGTVENRAKMLLEVIDGVTEVFGAGRVGVRLSPNGTFNDIHDEAAYENYTYIVNELDKLGLAYIHVVERAPDQPLTEEESTLVEGLREMYSGNYIANGGYDPSTAETAVLDGVFAVAFGRPYISNPDLAERIDQGAPLNEPDPDTFYGGDEKGYTDYPTYASLAS